MSDATIGLVTVDAPLPVAEFAKLVAEELANPDGSAPLFAEIAVGDLTEPAALDALRRGVQAIAAQAPRPGPEPVADHLRRAES
jgi:hypothetical protein